MLNLKEKSTPLILSASLIASAWVLGHYAQNIGTPAGIITVKGLAEKKIEADSATWSIRAEARGSSYKEALDAVLAKKPLIENFIRDHQFSPAELKTFDPTVRPRYVKIRYLNNQEVERSEVDSAEGFEHGGDNEYSKTTQDGFKAELTYALNSKDVQKIAKANRNAQQFDERQEPVSYSAPQYLVSNLEPLKMSLIAEATQNAKARAEEFVRSGNASLGAMHAANQGAFYILADNVESSDSDEYGGRYDKSTIAKNARLVVSVSYTLNR